MMAHVVGALKEIRTFRMTTFCAVTEMSHPEIETFSMTCPGVEAVMHEDARNVTPAVTPVFEASG
jgi:hypothetical protein